MKLYKMELYKLCCRKLFIVGVAAVMLIVLFTFWMQVMDEEAVTITAVCWGVPVLIVMFTNGFRGIGKLLAAAPVFMVIGETIDFIYDIWLMPIGIAVLVSIFCVFRAYWKYRGQKVC